MDVGCPHVLPAFWTGSTSVCRCRTEAVLSCQTDAGPVHLDVRHWGQPASISCASNEKSMNNYKNMSVIGGKVSFSVRHISYKRSLKQRQRGAVRIKERILIYDN